MADVANTDNGQLSRGRSVELRVAAKLENLAVLRTLVAAVGTFEDLDFDAVADLRLAVDEACTRLIRSAVPDSTLLLVVDPRDDAVVIDHFIEGDGSPDGSRTVRTRLPAAMAEIRVRTLFSGISTGTELTAYRGTNPYLHKRWDGERRLFVDEAQAASAYPLTG